MTEQLPVPTQPESDALSSEAFTHHGALVCRLPENKFFIAISYNPTTHVLGFMTHPWAANDADINPLYYHNVNCFKHADNYFEKMLERHLPGDQRFLRGFTSLRQPSVMLHYIEADKMSNIPERLSRLMASLNNKDQQKHYLDKCRKITYPNLGKMPAEFPQMPMLSDEEYAQVMNTLQLPEPLSLLARLTSRPRTTPIATR